MSSSPRSGPRSGDGTRRPPQRPSLDVGAGPGAFSNRPGLKPVHEEGRPAKGPTSRNPWATGRASPRHTPRARDSLQSAPPASRGGPTAPSGMPETSGRPAASPGPDRRTGTPASWRRAASAAAGPCPTHWEKMGKRIRRLGRPGPDRRGRTGCTDDLSIAEGDAATVPLRPRSWAGGKGFGDRSDKIGRWVEMVLPGDVGRRHDREARLRGGKSRRLESAPSWVGWLPRRATPAGGRSSGWRAGRPPARRAAKSRGCSNRPTVRRSPRRRWIRCRPARPNADRWSQRGESSNPVAPRGDGSAPSSGPESLLRRCGPICETTPGWHATGCDMGPKYMNRLRSTRSPNLTGHSWIGGFRSGWGQVENVA